MGTARFCHDRKQDLIEDEVSGAGPSPWSPGCYGHVAADIRLN